MSKYFTVAHSYVRTSKFDHTTEACTFASKIFLADKLQICYDRVSLKLKSLKNKG